MIKSIFYFLPCLVCATWVVSYKCRRKNLTQKQLMMVMFHGVFYFTTFAFYISPSTDYYILSVTDFINQPLILAIMAGVINYLYTHYQKRPMSTLQRVLLYSPSIVQGVAIWMLYLVLGLHDISHFHQHLDLALVDFPTKQFPDHIHPDFGSYLFHVFYFFDYILIDVIAGIMVLVSLWLCFKIEKKEGYKIGDIYRLWFKGRRTTPSRAAAYWAAQTLVTISFLMVFGRTFFYHNPWWGSVLAILVAVNMYCWFYCEYYSFLSNYSVKILTHADMRDVERKTIEINKEGAKKDNKEVIIDDYSQNEDKIEYESKVDSKEKTGVNEEGEDDVVSKEVLSPKMTALVERMKVSLKDKKVYTNSEVSIENLAKMLGTNRSTLSPLINQTYEMNFKTLIATLRIEEAKRLLKENPTTPLETIAFQCGFKDKVNFFRRFKEITGVTPRIWLTNQND